MICIFRYLRVTLYIQLFSFRAASVFNKLSSVQFSSVQTHSFSTSANLCRRTHYIFETRCIITVVVGY